MHFGFEVPANSTTSLTHTVTLLAGAVIVTFGCPCATLLDTPLNTRVQHTAANVMLLRIMPLE
jgi:hypothetical protein